MPEYIGKRLGPYFLNNIIHIAWGRNPVRLRVNTCDLDHPSALRVYQKSGFNILEEIVGEYSVSDQKDALIRDLSQNKIDGCAIYKAI